MNTGLPRGAALVPGRREPLGTESSELLVMCLVPLHAVHRPCRSCINETPLSKQLFDLFCCSDQCLKAAEKPGAGRKLAEVLAGGVKCSMAAKPGRGAPAGMSPGQTTEECLGTGNTGNTFRI